MYFCNLKPKRFDRDCSSTTSVAFLFVSRFLFFCPFFFCLSIIQRQLVPLHNSFHRLHLSVKGFMDSCRFLQHGQGCFTWFLEKWLSQFRMSSFLHDLISNSFIHARKFTGYSLLTRGEGGGKWNDVLTTYKAVTARGGQRIIAVFFLQ